MMNTESEFKAILVVLTDEDCEKLSVEILWSAFNFMKQVPNATIEESIEFGINEWVK